MFHMLNCFDLRPDVTIDDFQSSVDAFVAHMQSAGLAESMSAIER